MPVGRGGQLLLVFGDRGVEGGILLDAGGGNFAVHADAYGRKSVDYNIPGYPYLFDQTRPVNGRQPNSAAQADGASVGGSYIFTGGFIGAGFTGPANTLFEGQAQTKMESWEVNWRHQMFDQLSVLVGYREIHLGDSLHYAINSTVAFGEYDYANRLRGVQIGVEWALLPRANPLQVNLSGKIGRYDTGISGGISEFQGGNHTFIGSFLGSSSQYAWGSEAGVMVGYRLSDTVMVRAGYQALWLNDVGLASNAAARSLLNPSLLRTVGRDDIVFQSINVGLAIGY